MHAGSNIFVSDRNKNVAKHLQILEQIAEKKKFHPTKEPENWYKVNKQDLLEIKVSKLSTLRRPNQHHTTQLWCFEL